MPEANMSDDKDRLLIKLKGDVAFVKFGSSRILSDEQINTLHDQLVRFIKQHQPSKVMINFASVEYLSSAWLGKLINLYKSLQHRGIRLCIFNVIPQIYEVFSI